MRREIGREIDHAIELVSLIQVLQQLFPRGMGRRLIAARILGGNNLNMVSGERLGAKAVVNIRGIANNQHLHGTPLLIRYPLWLIMRIVRCQCRPKATLSLF